MKIRTLLTALLLVFGLNFLQAQNTKIGHINTNDLIMVMPEREEAEKALETFAKSLENQLTSMSLEYEKKLTDYQNNISVMSDPVKESKAEELQDLERRIREFQRKAQESLQKKENDLMEPIIEKANVAIKAVADANKYAYILDTSVGVVLHFPAGDDILPLVKKQMGL